MPTQSIPQENKMGTMPVKKLIFNMALPLIISMLIQALYNIVDSIFVSRISENIIRHGENIAPAEVESVIEQYSEEILHVKVVGVPDPVVQEEVACLIQTRGAEIDARDLRRFVKARLASYKVPKYVFCVEAFPMTDTGKIDQAAVKQLAAELAAERRT